MLSHAAKKTVRRRMNLRDIALASHVGGRLLDGVARGEPRGGAAFYVVESPEAERAQHARGRARTITARAYHGDGARGVEFACVFAKAWAERRARSARRVPRGVLGGTTHVEYLEVCALFDHASKFRGRNLFDLRDLEARLAPGVHAAAQVAAHRVVADARESRHGLVHLRFSIGDDDERRAQGDERARPARELPAQADVERAGD